jgi:transcription initiation factor TFIID subunit 2/histone acetyltransferase MYST3
VTCHLVGKDITVHDATVYDNFTGRNQVTIDGNQATVYCQSVFAFRFSNSSNITMRDISFIDCGYHHQCNDCNVLEFINCSDVHIDGLSFVSNSHGLIASYLIYIVDALRTLSLRDITVYGSSLYGGIVIFQSRSSTAILTDINMTNVIISNNTFHYNYDLSKLGGSPCLVDYALIYNSIVGSAITFALKEPNKITSNIALSNVSITDNTGTISSGLLFLIGHVNYLPDVTIDYSTFSNNSNHYKDNFCHGSSLLVVFLNSAALTSNSNDNSLCNENANINITETTFTDHRNTTPVSISTVRAAKCSCDINFLGVNFANNHNSKTGVCLSAVGLYGSAVDTTIINIIFNNVNAFDNQLDIRPVSSGIPDFSPSIIPGLFEFENIDIINITCKQSCIFSNNTGSVFLVVASDVSISGNVIFSDNNAFSGAAFQLHSFSHIFLNKPIDIKFSNNTADNIGGAITSPMTDSDASMCIIQFKDSNPSDDFKISFSNNSALNGIGNNIFAAPLYDCQQVNLVDPTRNYDKILDMFNITDTVTAPTKVKFCCKMCTNNMSLYAYPGSQNITISIVVMDYNNNTVPTDMYIYNVVSDSQVHLNQSKFHYHPTKNSCVSRDFTISASKGAPNITTFLIGPMSLLPRVTLNVHLMKCPLGFENIDGVCRCNDFIQQLNNNLSIFRSNPSRQIKCDINKGLSRSFDFWLGSDINSTQLYFSQTCPLEYCAVDEPPYIWPGSHRLCSPNSSRTGLLCSQCKKGYSAVLGSTRCDQCSNWTLFYIIPLIVSGIIFVLLIYVLRLTLDHGTIDGIIFYTNVLQIYQRFNTQAKIINNHFVYMAFLDIMNFRMFFEACFYDGMSDLVKYGLMGLFIPLLLLILVGIIIIASRVSTKLSNFISKTSVQVITTIIHFSFIRLLSIVIEICAPTWVYSMGSDNQLQHSIKWFFNASITYGEGSHIFFMFIASVVAIFILLPYTVITTFAPFCYGHRLIQKFRPVFDTIYNPYRDSTRFWFGLRQCVLVLLYVVYAATNSCFKKSQSRITLGIIMAYFILNLWFKPFKTYWLNLLNNWYILNIVVVAMLDVNITSTEVLKSHKQTFEVFIILAMCTFTCTIIYHVLLCLSLIPCLNDKLFNFIAHIRRRIPDASRWSSRVIEMESSSGRNCNNSLNINYSNLRESLLSSGSHNRKRYGTT